MDELKYVLKCFLFACLVVMMAQIKTGDATIESRVENYLTHSEAAHFMREAAVGGAKAIQRGFLISKAFIQEKIGSSSEASEY